MKTDNYIQVTEVVYTYPDGDFSLHAGSFGLSGSLITCITGVNGSGKTTLGKLLAGIYKPVSGKILMENEDTTRLTLGEIGGKTGYLWQRCEQQLFAQTVRDELLFINKIINPAQTAAEKKQAEEEAMAWLSLFSLTKYADGSSFHLSRGEKQRLALAAVLNTGARYLILDEPTAGLDMKNKEILERLLTNLSRKKQIGMTIISHDKEFINALAARIITLSGGEIISDRQIYP